MSFLRIKNKLKKGFYGGNYEVRVVAPFELGLRKATSVLLTAAIRMPRSVLF
jgi:hypothetical protein